MTLAVMMLIAKPFWNSHPSTRSSIAGVGGAGPSCAIDEGHDVELTTVVHAPEAGRSPGPSDNWESSQ